MGVFAELNVSAVYLKLQVVVSLKFESSFSTNNFLIGRGLNQYPHLDIDERLEHVTHRDFPFFSVKVSLSSMIPLTTYHYSASDR